MDLQRSATRTVVIDSGHAGRRIDNFLNNLLGGMPKSHLYRLLRRGEVRINGGRIQPSYRLQEGDKVRIPPIRQPIDSGPVKAPSTSLTRRILDSIVVDEEAFLVIDKPAGIAVHGGSGVTWGVIEALRAERGDLPYLELVHRLDRATSGCLLLAKDPRFLRGMHELIRAGEVEKRYLALVSGYWRGGERVLAAGLQRSRLRSGERMVEATETGKTAVTIAKVREHFTDVSLLDVRILTGRTHQIRVHLADGGHPIAGDEKYGDVTVNKQFRQLGLRQMFLHAHVLRFRDPLSGTLRDVKCRLQENHEHVLAVLRTKVSSD